ncbi:hypothetical protein HYZ98_02535 [Candidatus Peregrinibacteria bacterium]|nr:hypothetical protein [Candidatus Peregrinibacteria bacterium]
MHIDDIIRALKPILGDRINPLIALYLAGDDENKRTAERILRLTYLQMVSGIQAPREHLGSGKYPLGVVLQGEKPVYPMALRDEDFFHLGIFSDRQRQDQRHAESLAGVDCTRHSLAGV